MGAKYNTGCIDSNKPQPRSDHAGINKKSCEPFRKRYSPNSENHKNKSSGNELFTIIHGTLNTRKNQSPASKQLLIGNTVYDTVVEGISSINQCKDYQGILQVEYEHDNQIFYIIFALFFSTKAQSYFLISLGEYSLRSYQQDIEHFRNYSFNQRLHISLSPISREGITDLGEKLLRTNLSKATVCLLKDTLRMGPD